MNALIAEEERAERSQDEPGPHQSLAAAYLHLIRRFDSRMVDVADHLMISLSYCYQRCAHARRLAVRQQSIPRGAGVGDGAFLPGAWRSYRLWRHPVQLVLDFGPEPLLFAAQEI